MTHNLTSGHSIGGSVVDGMIRHQHCPIAKKEPTLPYRHDRTIAAIKEQQIANRPQALVDLIAARMNFAGRRCPCMAVANQG